MDWVVLGSSVDCMVRVFRRTLSFWVLQCAGWYRMILLAWFFRCFSGPVVGLGGMQCFNVNI